MDTGFNIDGRRYICFAPQGIVVVTVFFYVKHINII